MISNWGHKDCNAEILRLTFELKKLERELRDKYCSKCADNVQELMCFQGVIDAQKYRLEKHGEELAKPCGGHKQQIDTLLLVNKELRKELSNERSEAKRDWNRNTDKT